MPVDSWGSAAAPCKIQQNPSNWIRSDTRAVPRICVSGGDTHGPRRPADWLRAEAKADLTRRTYHHAANLGLRPKRISVRDQSTRWGSCSTTGTICYSWRLIFAPEFVLDYVAAHEVAHLREMNHGPRFWRLVRDTMPDMQKARAWLKQNGAELHRFGATA
jgi:predicted metal-dependent hydrolase